MLESCRCDDNTALSCLLAARPSHTKRAWAWALLGTVAVVVVVMAVIVVIGGAGEVVQLSVVRPLALFATPVVCWLLAGFLVLFAGLMSGLTLGLLSQDAVTLEVLQNSGNEKEKRWAHKIKPLVERHHLLLVTLLLMNAAAMEALPVILDKLMRPAFAVLISVTVVLIFGEIVPQAVCQRYALRIGAFFTNLVWVLVVLAFPVAWPLSKLLDKLLGTRQQGTFYRRAELKELVVIHGRCNNTGEANEEQGLTSDEVGIITGALEMRDKTVSIVMTPLNYVFMLSADNPVDSVTRKLLHEKGHSRVPIFQASRDRVIGMLLVKDLIVVNDDPARPLFVGDLPLKRLPQVPAAMPLCDALNLFQTGRSHMALVTDPSECDASAHQPYPPSFSLPQ
eukprot:TRINITY_DN8411_c0_g1_i2.p1 TRINITY_DN8411_c0_g1~~TRINITY_DN8411_c0_g1_i2.p1  ORF type:complete len:394 (-),score=75.76 TRINITY_DN8411_c0_g1_i2:382-1563(-)